MLFSLLTHPAFSFLFTCKTNFSYHSSTFSPFQALLPPLLLILISCLIFFTSFFHCLPSAPSPYPLLSSVPSPPPPPPPPSIHLICTAVFPSSPPFLLYKLRHWKFLCHLMFAFLFNNLAFNHSCFQDQKGKDCFSINIHSCLCSK